SLTFAATLPPLPTGITIRGDRSGSRPGPELVGNIATTYTPLMLISGVIQQNGIHLGDYVRITGLRLAGPGGCVRADQLGLPNCLYSSTSDPNILKNIWGIEVGGFNPDNPEATGILIDHNELYDWPGAAIAVFDGKNQEIQPTLTPGGILDPNCLN